MNHIAHSKKTHLLLLILCLFCFVLILQSTSAQAKTVYVDDDADPGWYNATQVATVLEGINNASDGDTVFIYDGFYLEPEEIVVEINNIHISGQSKEGTIIHSENGQGLFWASLDSVSFSTMTLENASGEATAIAANGVTNLAIDNVVFSDNFGDIGLSGVTNLSITNVFCSGGAYEAIRLSNIAGSFLFESNTINGGLTGLSIDTIPFGSEITRCVFSNNTEALNIVGENILIYDNIFENNIADVGSPDALNLAWNTTLQPGPNIIGGPSIGGNFWDSYTGVDSDFDGFGDTPYIFGFESDLLPLVSTEYPPFISNPNPENYAMGVDPVGLVWSVTIDDINDDLFDWTIVCSNGEWVAQIDDTDGSKSIALDVDYNNFYTVWVNATDSSGTSNEIFYFYTSPELGHLYVDNDYNVEDPGWGVTKFDTISDALVVATDFSIIEVYNGEYWDCPAINKSVTIFGESRDGVVLTNYVEAEIHESAMSIVADNVILSNMSLIESFSGGEWIAGLKVFGSNGIFTNLNLSSNEYGIIFEETANSNSLSFSVLDNNFMDVRIVGSSSNNILHSNNILSNGYPVFDIVGSQGNLIYNNYIVADNPLYAESFSLNSWNVSKTPGINIIGGPYLGGNFWANSDGIGWSQSHSDIFGEGFTVPFNIYNMEWDLLPLAFTENIHPFIGTPSPASGSIDNPLDLNWSVPISDPDGFGFSWNIECSNGQSISSSESSNGTKTLYLTELAHSTTYVVWVSVYDGFVWYNLSFDFTTLMEYIDPFIPDDPPIADAGGPYVGFPGEAIVFDGSSSSDPDGYLTRFMWDFGGINVKFGQSVSYLFDSPGTYKVYLTVFDNEGNHDTDPATIIIEKANNPPSLDLDSDETPGEYVVHLTVTADDPDGDPISYVIDWDDGSSSTTRTLNPGESTVEIHVYAAFGFYDISVTANDGTTTTPYSYGVTLSDNPKDESDLVGSLDSVFNSSNLTNKINDRSLFGGLSNNEYLNVGAATILSIILLFLLNLFVEFASDMASEKAKGRVEDAKLAKAKASGSLSSRLSAKEFLSVLIASILFAFAITWSWVPSLDEFLGFFAIVLIISFVLFFVRESIRRLLCQKNKVCSTFYLWPVGAVMMLGSTFIGNTFSMAANHIYDESADIKRYGRVSFLVSGFLFLAVLLGLGLNMIIPSALIQIIVITVVLNLFIDLFPLKPMDGYEIWHWNKPVYVILYILVIITYVLVYFNF